jgi:hypothetical protein
VLTTLVYRRQKIGVTDFQTSGEAPFNGEKIKINEGRLSLLRRPGHKSTTLCPNIK